MSNNTSTSSVQNYSLDQPTGHPNTGILNMPEYIYVKFAFFNNLIVIPIICVLGLVGNVLGIGVLWSDSKNQRMSIYKYLWALSLFDIFYLLLGLIRSTPYIIALYDHVFANYFEEHMKLGTIYLDMVFAHSSTAMIIVMSAERLMALWKPLQSRITWLALYPVRIIMLCFFLNVLFLLPYPLTFVVDSYVRHNDTHYFIKFRDGSHSFMNAYTVIQIVFDYFLPACLLVFTNTTIPIVYSNFQKNRRNRLNIQSAIFNSHQTKITTTVLCITVMYFLLSIPNLFIKILAFYDKEYSFDGKYKITFWFFIDLSNVLNYINAAIDCFIYILNSCHYRRIWIKMYCTCYFRRMSYLTGSETTSGDTTNRSRNYRY